MSLSVRQFKLHPRCVHRDKGVQDPTGSPHSHPCSDVTSSLQQLRHLVSHLSPSSHNAYFSAQTCHGLNSYSFIICLLHQDASPMRTSQPLLFPSVSPGGVVNSQMTEWSNGKKGETRGSHMPPKQLPLSTPNLALPPVDAPNTSPQAPLTCCCPDGRGTCPMDDDLG